MERENSYVVVGIFVMTFFILMSVGLLWMEKHSQNVAYKFYKINTKDSATGLSEKAAVRFNGLTVGEISKLDINKENLEEISITIKVKSDIPIKVDTRAMIQTQGITGLSFVQLIGSSTDAKELKTSDEEDKYGIIKSTPSMISRVDKGMTTIFDRAEITLDKIDKIVSDDNLKNLEKILTNVSNLTSSFANTMSYIESKFGKFDNVLNSAVEVENSANSTLKLLSDKIKNGEFDFSSTLNENFFPIQNVVNEFNILLHQLRRDLETLKNSPSNLFFKSTEVNPGPGE